MWVLPFPVQLGRSQGTGCCAASEETALPLSLHLSLWGQVAQDLPVEQLQLLFYLWELQQRSQREAGGQGEVVHALGQEQGAAELQ